MHLIRPHQLLGCAVLGLSLLLSGCGFQLRGLGTDMVNLQELRIESRDQYSELHQGVKQALEDNGVSITTSAPFRLQLLAEERDRVAVSYTSRSAPAEYELTNRLLFQVSDSQGRPLVGPETLTARRVFVTDRDNITGSNQEEELLRQELRQDLIRQMLFRLSSLSESELSARAQALEQQATPATP
ncbi:LPS assembly lipoprotein LptE [Halopseudomonas laoshanensis]|nr:LPS assembly lipoprotein LptE [Halopseudomonas laoshanensis]